MMLCLEKRLKSNTCITAVESRREVLEIWGEDVRKPMFQSAFPDLDESLDQSGLATTAERSNLTETANIVWVWSFEDTRIYFSLQIIYFSKLLDYKTSVKSLNISRI